MIHNNILSTIGNTPLVALNKLSNSNGGTVVVKMESHNPGGSVKDRIARNMIEEAENQGVLKAGMTIVEPTSGNTGIGLAMIAAVKGYEAVMVMPETMSTERRALLVHYGAKIILTPGEKGMTGAMQKAAELASNKDYFMPQQFKNKANPDAHRKTTAKEIIRDLNGTPLDYLVAGVGTGGTITGAGEVLKSSFPEMKLIAVEPADSPVLSGGDPGPHKIQGIGGGFIPDVLNTKILDDIITVQTDDAIQTAKDLSSKEGILAGISAGANVWAALQVAKKADPGQLVLTILCDTGERYLSTDLFK
jgi:cysteine synthase A